MGGPTSVAELGRTIVAAFDPVLAPAGFIHAVDLKWVRSVVPEVRHVIEAAPGRHGGRVIHWGISLDFVPHLVGSAVRTHRTARTARLDLGFDPLNFQDEWDFGAPPWSISPDLGSPTPAERARAIAAALPGAAEPWFAPIAALASLPAAFAREEARTGGVFAFDDYVQYRLAWAFTLARLGRGDAAALELERWAGRGLAGPGALDELRGLLDMVGATDRAGG